MSNFLDSLKLNDLNKLEELILQGLKLNEPDEYGYTPLIHTVIKNNLDAARVILKHGGEVDAVDITGWSALQWAADDDNYEFCKFLLENGANPNHNSMDGQPALVYPLLRGSKDILKLFLEYEVNPTFAEDFIDAKLIGHRFELKGRTYIVTPKYKFVGINFEGFYIESTLGFLHRSLNAFHKSQVPSRFPDFKSYTSKILDSFKKSPLLVQKKYKRNVEEHEDIIKKLHNEELLLIPVTFEGHAITMIKYKNLFARCDRGVKKVVDTIVIWYMENSLLFTKEFLVNLVYENKTSDFMHTEIKEELKLKQIVSIPTESQLSGNCSWANVEASIPAMLFMLMFNGNLHDSSHIYALRKRVMNFYESWVEWDKDRMLNSQLSTFDEASPLRKASKIFSIGSIFEQRCNPDNNNDLARAKKILKILTIKDYMKILQGYIRLNNHPNAGEEGVRFMRLLEKCGIDKKQALGILRQDYVVDKLSIQEEEKKYNEFYELLSAVGFGELESVKKILNENQEIINFQDRNGNTVLMYAAWNGYIEMIKFLLEMGADLNIKNKKGVKAIDYAKYANNKKVIKLLLNKK